MKTVILNIMPVLLLATISTQTHAVDYFVNATMGNDSWDGNVPNGDYLPTGCETDGDITDCTNGPWKSLDKVSAHSYSAGDNVLFKRGETWHGTLTISSSGIENQPISYSSYGDEGMAKPVISGLVDISNDDWRCANPPLSSNSDCTGPVKTWYHNDYTSASRYTTWMLIKEENNESSRIGSGEYIYSSPDDDGKNAASVALDDNESITRYLRDGGKGRTTIYLRSDSGKPGTNDINVLTGRDAEYVIDTNNQSFITIKDLHIVGGAAMSSSPTCGATCYNSLKASTAILIRGNASTSTCTNSTCTNILIENNDIAFSAIAIANRHQHGDNGQVVIDTYNANYATISNNNVYSNAVSGIYLHGNSSNNKIIGNKVHHNYNQYTDTARDQTGIAFGGTSSSTRLHNLIDSNHVHDNGYLEVSLDHAIALHQTSRTTVTNNIIENNQQGVFYSGLNTFDNNFSYNIVRNNSVTNHRMIFLSSNNTPDEPHVATYNIIDGNTVRATTEPDGGNKYSWRLFSIDWNSVPSVVRNNIFSNNSLISETAYPVRLFASFPNLTNDIDNNIYTSNTTTGGDSAYSGMWQIGYTPDGLDFSEWQQNGYDITEDFDSDSVTDSIDNCPQRYNPNTQTTTSLLGDVCTVTILYHDEVELDLNDPNLGLSQPPYEMASLDGHTLYKESGDHSSSFVLTGDAVIKSAKFSINSDPVYVQTHNSTPVAIRGFKNGLTRPYNHNGLGIGDNLTMHAHITYHDDSTEVITATFSRQHAN